MTQEGSEAPAGLAPLPAEPRPAEPLPFEHLLSGRAADEFAGVPDGFGRLWTPHRLAYITGEHKPSTDEAGPECPFCRAPTLADDDGLIVHRGKLAYAVLNLFPYNSGHLMAVPYRHVADYADLTPAEVVDVGAITQAAMRVIRAVSGPHGFNIGMNQGAVAGAGIAGHLHQHVVPRWGGDTNFMPIVAQTRVLPQLLEQARQALSQEWAATAE